MNSPLTTNAAILVKNRVPLKILELTIPKLKSGQVLVKIFFSGMCGTQLMEWKGEKGEDKWMPHCMGHEGSGIVIQVSKGVKKVKVGDHVILSWIKGDGIEAGGVQYKSNKLLINAGPVTTFQKHAVVSENRLTKIDKDYPKDLAVLVGCAAPTGFGSVLNVLKLKKNDSIAIFGLGGVGLHACIAAHMNGASKIVAIDPNLERRNLALKFGATHTINPLEENIEENFDCAIDASGKIEAMYTGIKIIKNQGGKLVIISNNPFGTELVIDPNIFNMGKSLMGTWGGDTCPQRDYGKYCDILVKTRLPVRELFTKTYSLDQINLAMDDLISGRVGRPLIDMAL